jgi:hypothetical protein
MGIVVSRRNARATD